MAFSIGRPMSNPNACGIMAWETAEALGKTPDNVFMNISAESGAEIYKKARSNTSIVFQKLLEDKSKPDEKAIVNVYLPNYMNKVVVEGNSVEKFLGHYSLATTVQPLAAGIIFIKTSPTQWSNVLCVVSGENRPTYIFDTSKGTLECTDNLYDTIFNYIESNGKATLSAYIMSNESQPIVVKTEEPPILVEEDSSPVVKKTQTKKRAKEEEVEEDAPKKKPSKEEEEEEDSLPKKKASEEKAPTSSKKEEEEEETSPKKKVKEEDAPKKSTSSKKKRERSPAPSKDEEKKKEEKLRKRGPIRRRKLAELKIEMKE